MNGIPAFVSGTYCGRFDDLELIRGKSTTSRRRAVLLLTDNGHRITLDWPAGKRAVPWPSDFPPVDGGLYRLTPEGSLQSSEWLLHKLPPTLVDPTARIAWMIERQCQQQAAAALYALRRDRVPFALYLTSDRGRRPAYRIGERMTLLVKSSHDAFLYCYVWSMTGPTVAIFPTAVSGGAWIAGSELLELPGQRLGVPRQSLREAKGSVALRC